MRSRPALAAALAAALLAPAGASAGTRSPAQPPDDPRVQPPDEPPAQAAPANEAERPRAAGSEVPAPKRKKLILPEYPQEAKNRGVRGIVLVELVIERDGRVGEARVLRGIPLLDEAALLAVRQWEYEVTKVGGQPVRVLLSVPITFSLKLPEVTRQEGVPELRSGVVPAFPAGGGSRATVEAELTLDAEGKVTEILVTRGDSPWTDEVFRALRTWVFQPEHSGAVVSFKLRADFRRGAGPDDSRVQLELSSPRVTETIEPPSVPAAAVPAPSAPGPAEEAAAPSRPAEPPVEVLRVPLRPQPAPAATPEPGAPADAGAPLPAPTPAPTPSPAQPGVSAVRDVSLGPGVPDLTAGRRPLVPPLLRMARETGSVRVEFSVGTSGATQVGQVEGPEPLHEAARQMVASWVFRRISTERLFLTASVQYGDAMASAVVTLATQ